MRFTPKITDLMHSPIGEAHALLAHRVNDRPLLDLSQAAPSYPPPRAVIDAIAAASDDPSIATYAPQPGLPPLRDAFAADLRAAYEADNVDPADVLITAGCNQAFCVVATALAGGHAGSIPSPDNVILQTPFYFNHDMWLRVEGVEPRHLPPGPGLIPTIADAEALLDDHTRAIVLVTPGNPTGVTVPPDRIADFAALARHHDIALIVDETYRSFRDTDAPAHRLFDDPDWGDTVISLHSFSKDLAIPGYRVGAVVSGRSAQVQALKVLDCVAISAPAIGQAAAIAGLQQSGEWRREQAARVREHQRLFEAVMAARPGGFELVAAGAYFGWVQAPVGLTEERTNSIVRRLVVDHDVLVIPGTAFTPTDEGKLRFSFANLDAEQIATLGDRLAEWTP